MRLVLVLLLGLGLAAGGFRKSLLASGRIGFVLGFLGGQFFWSRHAAHDGAVHLVGDFFGLPVVVHLADGKGRQVAFLVEHSVPGLHREIPLHISLAVRRLIAMLIAIASEDANLQGY